MTPEQAAAYLAAFIDGEGHVSCNMTSRGRTNKQVAFSNTDKQLFDAVIDIAKSINIEFRVYFIKSAKPEWSDKWIGYLKGGKPAFEQFRATVPIQCAAKRGRLDDIINSYLDPEAIYAKQRTAIKVQCQTCGTPFHAFPSDLARGQGKYCSHKCGCIGRTRKIERVCASCGNTYFVNPARTNTTRYCSHACVGSAQADRLRGLAQKAANTRWEKQQ